jgi:phosphoribosyl 1,2-cyclic phosphodiesterase
MADSLADVDLLGVEFNYDVDMQRRSRRSPDLIARNLGDWGHLSNDQGAGFVTAVLARSSPRAVRQIVLLHLSLQCNHPTLALDAARVAIRERGRKATLHAALQFAAFPNLLLRPARRPAAVVGPREASRPAPEA